MWSQINFSMRQFAAFALYAAAAVLLAVTLTGTHGVLRLVDIQSEIGKLTQKDEALEAQLGTIAHELGMMEMGRFALEKKAREDLGLAKRTDTVYIFPDKSTVPSR
jgi:cell division protein FtsB